MGLHSLSRFGRWAAERVDLLTGIAPIERVATEFALGLRRTDAVLVVCLRLADPARLGASLDYSTLMRLNRFLANRVPRLPGAILRLGDRVAVGCALGGEFVLLIRPASAGRLAIAPYAASIADRLQEYADALLAEAARALALPEPVRVRVGWVIAYPGGGNADRPPYHDAIEAAVRATRTAPVGRLDELVRRIIAESDITTLLQPIVSLRTGRTIACEALVRGPRGSELEMPLRLFEAAEAAGVVDSLDRLCVASALAAQQRHLADDQRLFVNLNPATIVASGRRGAAPAGEGLISLGLLPTRTVVEVTERQTVGDMGALREVLRTFQECGGGVAVDDVGAGYSNLRAIAALRPRYLKIDRELVAGIHRDPAKRALLETFTGFAHRVGASIVGEGVETADELAALCEIGVDYAQGYFLGRPASPPPSPRPAAIDLIRRSNMLRVQLDSGGEMHVGALATPALTIGEGALGEDVHRLFESAPDRSACIVTAPDGRPVGLLMRDKAYGRLGTQYGYSIYTRRPVSLMMDRLPLIVDVATPVTEAAQAASARDADRLYDDLIATRHGLPVGVVSVSRLLEATSRLSIQRAREANPLTGLPGNPALHAELTRRLERGQPFTLLYVDLNNFKRVNDVCGFAAGDGVIRNLADILREAFTENARVGDLLGHIGGDDFLVIVHPECAEALCGAVRARFDAGEWPLSDLSISVAAVPVKEGEAISVEDLARRAAEAKERAKRRGQPCPDG